MEKLDYKISLVIVDSDIDLEPTHEISQDAQNISLVIVDSDINLEPTHEIDPDAPKIDLMFSTIFKGDPGDPGQAKLTQELVAELSIGGVSSGMVFPVGTLLEDILREMFTSRARVGSAIVGRSRIS